jgi:hypothetical protein
MCNKTGANYDGSSSCAIKVVQIMMEVRHVQ